MRLASRLPRSALLLALLAAGSVEARTLAAAAQPPTHPRTVRCNLPEQDPLPEGAKEAKRQKRVEERESAPSVVRGQVLSRAMSGAEAMAEAVPIGGAQVVLFRGEERRATIRSTPGVEAILIVSRGRFARHKLDALATQRVLVTPTSGVQHVKIELR